MTQNVHYTFALAAGSGEHDWESYKYGDNVIFWSSNYDYHIVSQSGATIRQGRLTGEEIKDTVAPLTFLSCYWFCKKDANNMLYVSWNADHSAFTFKVWNFDEQKSSDWSKAPITADRKLINNFAWLNFRKEGNDEHVQFAWQNGDKIRYARHMNGDEQSDETVDLMNPYGFSVENNVLITANNFKQDNLMLHVFHTTGHRTVEIKWDGEFKYTWQDFGMLDARWMFIIVNEGDAGNSGYMKKQKGADCQGCTAQCFLLDTNEYNLMEAGQITEGALKRVVLDEGYSQLTEEQRTNGVKPDLPDGFFMVNRQSKTLYAPCGNGNFVAWDLFESEAGWECKKRPDTKEAFACTGYTSSWDNESLWSWRLEGDQMHMDMHSKATLKWQYLWLLLGRTKANKAGSPWIDTDLADAVQMLVE